MLNKKVTITTEAISRVNQDGTIVIMKMNEDEFFYKIDGVAAVVWQKFTTEGILVSQIIDEILSEYNVSKEVLVKDIENFLKKAEEYSLINLK